MAASEVSIRCYLTLAGDSVWLELVTTATKTLGSLIWYVSALLPTKVIRTLRVRRNFNWRVHGHRAYKDKIHIICCWKDFKGYWVMQCAGCKDFVTVVIAFWQFIAQPSPLTFIVFAPRQWNLDSEFQSFSQWDSGFLTNYVPDSKAQDSGFPYGATRITCMYGSKLL